MQSAGADVVRIRCVARPQHGIDASALRAPRSAAQQVPSAMASQAAAVLQLTHVPGCFYTSWLVTFQLDRWYTSAATEIQARQCLIAMQQTFTTSSSCSRLVCDSSTLREAWQSGSPCAEGGGALRVTVHPNLTCAHLMATQ